MHLTKLAHVVQMTTQYTHLDAMPSQNDKTKPGAKPSEPRLAVVQEKKGLDNPAVEKAKKFLNSTFEEKWLKMRYFDDNEDQSFERYEETLFLEKPAEAPPLRANISKEDYVDAVSAPSIDRGLGKKKIFKKPIVELSETSCDEDDDDHDEEDQEERGMEQDDVVPSTEVDQMNVDTEI